jgi:hypothetical protein
MENPPTMVQLLMVLVLMVLDPSTKSHQLSQSKDNGGCIGWLF